MTFKILVIDDEYSIRHMLKEVFEFKGYQVLAAANGQEGLEIYDEFTGQIDLVILDVVMPVMGGHSTFQEIRDRKGDQKIIIISGYSEQNESEDILLKGAQAFMHKPFHLGDIVKQVEEVLKK